MFCRWLRIVPVFCLIAVPFALAAPQRDSFRCHVGTRESFSDTANRFLLATLLYAPVEATQAGYHGNPSAPLDNQLDDASPATLAAERALLLRGKLCFAAVHVSDPEEKADLALIRDGIESSFFHSIYGNPNAISRSSTSR